MTSSDNINHLISSELNYFKPMILRSEKSDLEQRQRWQKETVRERQERISLEVFDLCNGIVKYGPFKGMKLNRETWWGKADLGSQCLGFYEKEILKEIENLEPSEIKNFIDIGAADGYYAVGISLSKKIKKTICFEQSEVGRDAILKNAINNNIHEKISIEGRASSETICQLDENDLQDSLALIDIEGGEFELLNHATLEKLKNTVIIIEIHNWVENFENKYKELLERISITHEIEIIKRLERPTLEISELRDFTDDNRLLLTSERRPCVMRFLKLSPLKKYHNK